MGHPMNFTCLVLGWGFQGQQIEWHYFRFDQIQEVASGHLGKFQMAISPQQDIRSSVGFSGLADHMVSTSN